MATGPLTTADWSCMALGPAGYQTLNENIAGIDKVQLTPDGWRCARDFTYSPVAQAGRDDRGALLLPPFGASTPRVLRKRQVA